MERQTQAFELRDHKSWTAAKSRLRDSFIVCATLILCLSGLNSCTQTRQQTDNQQEQQTYQQDPNNNQAPEAVPGGQQGDGSVGQDDILAAQANQDRKVELTFSAPVCRLLPDDTKGLPHQLFLVQLNNGSMVKIAHDTKYAPHVPIRPGDLVTIKGEFIYNRKGGVVHWTHHSDTPRHEGGYIEFGGKRYE